MLPGEDDRRSHRDEDEHDRDDEEPRGWSKPELPKSEPEPVWGVENAAHTVPQNPKEQWGGRAGSTGDDSGAAPVVQVPDGAATVKSRR